VFQKSVISLVREEGRMYMLTLSKSSIKDHQLWNSAGIETLNFDYDQMVTATKENPTWVHFGAGNIFRGFIAALQQTLLNKGTATTGIIAVETYDHEIIEKIYEPYDNLSLLAIMNRDGSLEKRIIGSIGESLTGDTTREDDWQRLKVIFSQPSLQLASFTITEKGYGLTNITGNYLPTVAQDLKNGPKQPQSVMAIITALAYERYQQGQLPIALVSLDNCSHNGEKLCQAIQAIAKEWVAQGFVEKAFLDYLNNPAKVSFPWSMIDKITPRPAESVKQTLNACGFGSTDLICTSKNTFIAPFVNAEKPQYLVMEDHFPNGRMKLEEAGVMFTDRQTVNKVEKMKVCTCLNPLHTALAIFGCLLGYTLIADEMNDRDLKKLIEKIGYDEGMPVVVTQQILDPQAFIKEVIEVRLPNPYIPDTPQRIATDTSQKVGIRFGETIKAYCQRPDLDSKTLVFIPLSIAGWCRYLMGVDDQGQKMPLSSDPLLDSLQTAISQVKLGESQSVQNRLHSILANKELFGVDLYLIGLGEKIEGFLQEMIAGKGAVRATLQKYLALPGKNG
jgi:fructuronate reductase